MFEKQSPTFDITMAIMLCHIINIAQAAQKIGNSTPRQYCLEIGKQNATLKFLKFILMED